MDVHIMDWNLARRWHGYWTHWDIDLARCWADCWSHWNVDFGHISLLGNIPIRLGMGFACP